MGIAGTVTKAQFIFYTTDFPTFRVSPGPFEPAHGITLNSWCKLERTGSRWIKLLDFPSLKLKSYWYFFRIGDFGSEKTFGSEDFARSQLMVQSMFSFHRNKSSWAPLEILNGSLLRISNASSSGSNKICPRSAQKDM